MCGFRIGHDSTNLELAQFLHLFLITIVPVTDADSMMHTPAQAVPCAEDDRMMLLNLPL